VLRVNYLDSNGASAGNWYGSNATPAWIYDSASDSVYGVIQRYNHNGENTPLKENTLFQYKRSDRTMYKIGVGMTDDGTIVGAADQHGVGTLCFDHYGHLHMYGGGHNMPMKHSILPKGASALIADGDIGGGYTYSHPAHVGTTQWLFCRYATSGTYPGVYRKSNSIDPTNGKISWSAEQTIIDMQSDTRVYFGLHQVVGNKIYLCWTRANATDTVRMDLYIGVFDTTNESFSNLSGSVVITKAQMPLTRTVADASFRIVDQTTGGTEESNTPTMYIDAEGIHLLYQGGVGGNTYIYQRRSMSGALLEGPTNLGTAPYRYATPNIGPLPGGGVEVLFPVPDNQVLDMDTEAVFTRGGSIYRRARPAGGSWSNAELVMQTTSVHPLDAVTPVKDGPADFRFAFCERAIDDNDYATGGNNRSYGWGSNGLVTTPFVEDDDAKAFIARNPTAYVYTDKDRIRVTNFFRGMKDVGWKGRSDLTYLMSEPVKEMCMLEAWGGVPLTEVGGTTDFVPYKGIKSTASAKLQAAFNISSAPNKKLNANGVQLAIYPTENVQSGSSDMGTTATTATMALGARGNTGNASALLFNTTAITQAVPRADILFMAQRAGTRNELYWRGKMNVKPATVASATLPNGNLTLGGNSTGFSQRRLGYAHIGRSIDVGPVAQVIKRYIYEASLGG
jgi:hypothetical protein